jgi:hypothetical protein
MNSEAMNEASKAPSLADKALRKDSPGNADGFPPSATGKKSARTNVCPDRLPVPHSPLSPVPRSRNFGTWGLSQHISAAVQGLAGTLGGPISRPSLSRSELGEIATRWSLLTVERFVTVAKGGGRGEYGGSG